MKIKLLFIKYNKILFELIINIFSFSIFIISQQIIALPVISRFYDVNYFGKIVIAIGFVSIITSMFGFSIGNARLLDQKYYNFLYLKTFLISNIYIGLISIFIFYIFFSKNYIDSIVFSIICVLGNFRNFFQSEYRIINSHSWLLKQNLWYFCGVLFGCILFSFQRNWLVVFFTAEVFSVCFSTYFFIKSGFFKMFTDNSKLKSTNIIQLIINNGSSYSLSQYDRFLIYPILGPANVSLFYSASVSSKIGGLILNPLSNYILGKLSLKKQENKRKLIKIGLLASLSIAVVYFLLSIATTPILVGILYPNYLTKVETLIIPICLGGAIMGGVNILKPITMKYLGVKYYNKLFFIYGITLIILSLILCIKYNLLGLAIAKVISSAALFLILLVSLKKVYSSKR